MACWHMPPAASLVNDHVPERQTDAAALR